MIIRSAVAVGICAYFGLFSAVLGQSTFVQQPTDWDLYMLRLVNDARTDPLGEDARQGTDFGEVPVPPLAYSSIVGRVAQNHNEWMGANRNNPLIDDPSATGSAPDSFAHFETLSGQSTGASGAGETDGWSGDNLGQRVDFVGYEWGAVGENILWKSFTPEINVELIDLNHKGWWESDGHRRNIMNPTFTVFGHHVLNDQTGPQANHWATQVFSRPLRSPRNHVFGLLYDDLDQNGDWTPLDQNDVQREGLGGISYAVRQANSNRIVASGTTLDNGSYTVDLGSGNYDIIFEDPSLPSGLVELKGIQVTDFNIDAGDLAVSSMAAAPQLMAGDANQDFQFDQRDIVRVLAGAKYLTGGAATWGDGDWNGAPGGSQGSPPTGDGVFDQFDLVAAQQAGIYRTGSYAATQSGSTSWNSAVHADEPTQVGEIKDALSLVSNSDWALADPLTETPHVFDIAGPIPQNSLAEAGQIVHAANNVGDFASADLISRQVVAVPEPSPLLLLLIAGSGFSMFARSGPGRSLGRRS